MLTKLCGERVINVHSKETGILDSVETGINGIVYVMINGEKRLFCAKDIALVSDYPNGTRLSDYK